MGNRLNKGEVPSSPQETGRWMWITDKKVACEGKSVDLAGAEREPFAKVFFKLNCTGNERHTRVQLTMEQVHFGVRNCCTRNCHERSEPCGKNCKTVFIYKVTIQVIPKPWAQDCHRLLVQPYPTAAVFGLQRSVTLGSQVPLDPRQASVTYLRARTVSSTALEFGWSPARTDDSSNSVAWQWELYRYTNGSKFEFKSRWGTRPLLGIQPDQMHIHPGSFPAEALWELPPNAELQLQQLQWDVKIPGVLRDTNFVQLLRFCVWKPVSEVLLTRVNSVAILALFVGVYDMGGQKDPYGFTFSNSMCFEDPNPKQGRKEFS